MKIFFLENPSRSKYRGEVEKKKKRKRNSNRKRMKGEKQGVENKKKRGSLVLCESSEKEKRGFFSFHKSRRGEAS